MAASKPSPYQKLRNFLAADFPLADWAVQEIVGINDLTVTARLKGTGETFSFTVDEFGELPDYEQTKWLRKYINEFTPYAKWKREK